jgi:hypothetical protein
MSNSSLAAGNDPVAESIRRAVSGYAAAWLAGDRPAMLASYHDDFTLHYFGRMDCVPDAVQRPYAAPQSRDPQHPEKIMDPRSAAHHAATA